MSGDSPGDAMTDRDTHQPDATFDALVIGSGNAGTAMADTCRKAGWSVAVADERPFGGVCMLRGCIPKKVLTGAAEVIERARALQGEGLAGDLRISWPDLMQFKEGFTDPAPQVQEGKYRERGIVSLHGHASFVGPNLVWVGEQIVAARYIGITTGSLPRRLGIPGEEHLSTSDDFLSMENLPPRIAFIGGGYISFELGHVAALAGADVTILHRGGRVLKEFDPFLVDLLLEAFRERGITVVTDMPVQAIEKKEGHLVIHAGDDRFEADMVVHGAGRVQNIAALDLAKGNVETDARGIVTSPYLQSVSNPSVYVAGDAHARGKAITSVAIMEGRIAGKNMVNGNTLVPDYSITPSALFTYPPLGSVGLLVSQVKEKGIKAVIHTKKTEGMFSARRIGLHHSGYTIITEEETGKILGAHLLGYNADEVINLLALAMKVGIPLSGLHDVPWTYPTATYDLNRIH
ncbi:MAG TPA: NAD(P)/FAD-dependent oxidoreductase [Methanomicrobiales archaeon]|nr:NAD(P)/FAD-dependent oxidoreductase [Methanomicrobiales archaeon]